MRTGTILCFTLGLACTRPSDQYDVHVYGASTDLDTIETAPRAMGGQIEYARYRFWGTNLSHGLTGLWGDEPRADGTSVTIGYAFFGYPLDPGFDQNSTFLSPGPRSVAPGSDGCTTRTQMTGYYGVTEYVDVGDHIELRADDNTVVRLERDPSVHHRPAGESWYAGYGGDLLPVIQEHETLPSNWASDEVWTVRFPGTALPPDSTMGAVPYPATGELHFPPDIENLYVEGSEVRAPHHFYNDNGVWDPDYIDDIRFPGPWDAPISLTWSPSESTEEARDQPLTVVVRLLGTAEESTCDCNASCGDGFSCIDGSCVGNEGSGWSPMGELVCTVADDGEFKLTPVMLDNLWQWVDRDEVAGAVLLVSRQREGTLSTEDALSFNGKAVPLSPVRTRALDIIATRLEAP